MSRQAPAAAGGNCVEARLRDYPRGGRLGRGSCTKYDAHAASRELPIDCRLDAAIATEREHLVQQVPRGWQAQRLPHPAGGAAGGRRHQHPRVNESARPAVQLEDAGEVLERRVVDRNLVGNAAQERLVGQRRGIEVGREHRQHVERHLELLAGVQGQDSRPRLERHDPPVEQIVGPDALAAEVVHQEHAAVGPQLQRRLVEPRDRVEGQVELIERELAADHDDGPPDAHPAAIARRRGMMLVGPVVAPAARG